MKTFTAAVVGALAIALPRAASADTITPPPVPTNLEIEYGNKPFLIGHAYGTQNYVCLPSGGSYAWILYGPQATLFSDKGDQMITHFLSPNPVENGAPRATWQQAHDTSAVWAVATAISTDANYVAPGAIPWLRLQVVGAQYGPGGGDKLTPTTFIHRVNTEGGVAPATGCAVATDVGRKTFVPYTTDYIFYKHTGTP